MCACFLVQHVDFFTKFDAMSPVHMEVSLYLSLRIGGGDLEETLLVKSLQNTPHWEPSIWLIP